MVKYRFPGRPGKSSQKRRRHSAQDCDDFDGRRAADEAYCKLSVFSILFSDDEDEGSSFHGFSPHEIALSKKRGSEKSKLNKKRKIKKTDEDVNVGVVDRKEVIPVVKQPEENPQKEKPKSKKEEKPKKEVKKDEKPSSSPVKFVLPTRSVHSSRVIKPNKRFFQNETADEDGNKKQRLANGDASEKNEPAKCILRKPMLNIKSQSVSIEGPFSSSGGSSIVQVGDQAHPTKVVCGVCGTTRPCKSYRQARKFGIFSCDPCRRFIIKIIRKEKDKLIDKFICDSGTGNCSIRYSALVTQPFSTEPQVKEHTRCQGCWLNLCLRSFKLPPQLTKRLASYLPLEISKKTSLFDNLVTKWPDSLSEKLLLDSTVKDVNEKRKTGLKIFREPDFKQKGKPKMTPAGPRVKHVCRSASLVLGQSSAKLAPRIQKSPAGQEVEERKVEMERKIPEIRVEQEVTLVPEKPQKEDVFQHKSEQVQSKADPKEKEPDRPIARMLQDLGRDNCDLLDGIERHESEKRFAKVSIDFWESYDPDEVAQMGFPLLACTPLKTQALCFLCGSAGFEKLIHCASCCEPYHTFCVATLRFAKKEIEWWKIDWLCPRCSQCEICLKSGAQLTCTKCFKNYHTSCMPQGRANISESWVCPSCLYCKSCNDPTVHVFVGNMPLCKACFKLRKQGSFCPLCQRCYDDNDYSTKMMECAKCNSWIHAKCEGLSNEKYQVLSYLPSSIEFICRLCCKDPPPFWLRAVNADLKAGYLNVIKSLSKNRLLCSLVKASPKKRVCDCQDIHRKPIHLRNLTPQNDISEKPYLSGNDSPTPTIDDKNSDLGLLTPKLTKDDEESLKTVKTGFLDLVSEKEQPQLNDETIKASNNLLSIAFKSDITVIKSDAESLPAVPQESQEKKCTCNLYNSSHQSLSLMGIKHKASSDEYSSVVDFNNDMEKVIGEIGEMELTKLYWKSLKQVFPWYDPSIKEDGLDTSIQDLDSSLNDLKERRKSVDADSPKKAKLNDSLKKLLTHEPDYYYIGLKIQDTRFCMLCKSIGEGHPKREGRLLYCGQNEWVHVNCALWSSEVFEEIDGSLQNVHSAISRGRLIRCFGCDKKGASVGCCAKSCPYAYHFSCALTANCIFLENMEVYCKNHGSLVVNKAQRREEDFSISRSVYVELDHKKKKDVLYNEVKLYIGALAINCVGELLPEYSDLIDFILPCDYNCTRLYWSVKEPWKIVPYHIKTKLTKSSDEYCFENETNYTLDHSLEFTPPPSPVEEVNTFDAKDDKVVKTVVSFLIDTVCSKDDDNTDQQTADLLPPELKEAIFEDLPHDLLDRISMHDIFTKMNFDDDKLDLGETSVLSKKPIKDSKSTFKYSSSLDIKKPSSYFKGINFSNKVDKQENYLERGKDYWKTHNLLQVDGAMDFSESDQSNDSTDINMQNCNENEEPVKCTRCRRTYRSSVGYERHLPTCSDYLSSTESDSSEEEKTQDATFQQNDVQVPCQASCPQNVEVNPSYVQVEQPKQIGIQNTQPAIILQPVQTEMPTYMPYQQQSQSGVQYITVDSQTPTYHIQQPIQQQVVQTVPTVVGTIITNGVDQIVLNNPNPPLDVYPQQNNVYPQQNNVYISNQPMIVGMETVVSNTVMSSSQFISGSVPGMLASSYSATTTQVFQATKPVIDVPQSYVVVNTNPQVVNNCVPNIMQSSPQTPWNNYQVNYQESYKVNKNVSYQTVTRQIIHEQKEIDGVKMINSTQETIVIEPITKPQTQLKEITVNPIIDSATVSSQQLQPYVPPKPNPENQILKLNQIKIDLPHSSAIHKEKPQQAVAPVVVKRISQNICNKVNKMPLLKPIQEAKKIEQPLQQGKVEQKPSLALPQPPPKPKPPGEPMEVDKVPEQIAVVKTAVNKNVERVKHKKPENPSKRKIVQEEPKITYEITSEDGFSYCTSDIQSAWEKVFETVQRAREAKGLPLLSQNPFPSPNSMLKKMMGLGNNSVKYILEQLPGISGCSKYKPIYHKRKLSALEQEMSKVSKENASGCARTERVKHSHHKYDMFSWLASRHRRPPKLLVTENDSLSVISRRAASMNLPMAMRFRHLKETSKIAVGVFRSDIHGRGLFCLRDIESGEMVIEYAGEVIRSALTDKRERYYTAKGIGCYMFRIDDKSVVDATMKGNAARFINHSCEPNCYSRVVDILGKKHILIFALRKILQGEELTYDYKFPLEEEKINCHCLSKRCRKYLN
ncbi:histone-lysine N-methyltransferase trithorax [Cimex lectularius]|uniref:Histone-lysine N-methyltransferase trithorax n=1 Tax=Cimex lectularius TaxID=79782 RepID=A0A8I6RZ55_CIMLE|nr:histone-lysine N-methyltransferase trithorax [Cimex lectularius]